MAVTLSDNLIIAKVEGFKMFVDARDRALTPHLVLDGTWEPEVTKAVRDIVKPGMTFVDIGAHWGYYSLLAASCAPDVKVWSFEPDPRNYELLWLNLRLNGLKDRAYPQQIALWECVTERKLHQYEGMTGSGSLVSEETVDGAYRAQHTLGVTTQALDHYNITPDVIKLDAEGSESAILRGAASTLARSPRLKMLVEYTPELIMQAKESPIAFLRHLTYLGFTLADVREPTVRTNDVERFLDEEYVMLLCERSL